MKNYIYTLALFICLLTSCDTKPSLQKYFVEKAETKDFINVDLAPNFINTDSLTLSSDEKKALKSFDKMNVLVFKANDANKAEFVNEKAAVKSLLKNGKYDELIKYNSGKQGASISTLGTGEHLDEVVVFVHNEDAGFGVVRILGSDMTPNNVLTMVGLLQKANLNLEQLKPLQNLIKK